MGCSSRHHTVLLLLLCQALTLSAVHGDDDTELNCTNDFEVLHCQLKLANCTDHSLTLQSTSDKARNCSLRECGTGSCCCSARMTFYVGDEHQVTVWNRGRQLGSKAFGDAENLKPKRPTIISVTDTKGNLDIKWNTGMKGLMENELSSELTYHKRGDPVKSQEKVSHTTEGGLRYYRLSGRQLEPGTSYVFTVRSISDWSKKKSDSSAPYEFKTSSSDSVSMVVIISLSVAAVILSTAIFFCFAKIKAKWWDSVEQHPTPKLGILHSSRQEVLKPVPPVISSISMDPFDFRDNYQWSKVSLIDTSSGDYQKKSGIGSGSSCLSSHRAGPVNPGNISPRVQRALLNAFTKNNLDTQVQGFNIGGNSGDSLTSGSSGFINKTYAIGLPDASPPPPSSGLDHTKMLCDLDYHPFNNVAAGLSHQEESACTFPALQNIFSASTFPSTVMTDMSYQPCTANSGSLINA